MRKLRKQPEKPMPAEDEIFVAIDGFASSRPEPTGAIVRRGQRFYGGNEIVRQNFNMFVPDGEVLPAQGARYIEPAVDERRITIDAKLSDAMAMIATSSFTALARGVGLGTESESVMYIVNQGDRIHKDSALVKANPDRFEPVIKK